MTSHIEAWRIYCRKQREWRRAIIQRALREWDALPSLNARDDARAHLAAMPAERRAMLEQDWIR